MVKPDSAWAWLVTLSCFIQRSLIGGLVFTFGILYVDLLKSFDSGEALVAGVGSVLTALTCGLGMFK